jgi:hypothetical protein
VSSYRTAIEDTEHTILRRAKSFRNQVITVSVAAVATVGLMLALRSGTLLIAFLLLVPLCGGFFFADVKLLNRWRSGLLATWARKEIDLVAFLGAIRAHPKLPSDTLEAMLATLPSTGDLRTEQAIESATRGAIAATMSARLQDREDVLLLKVLASAIVVVSVLASVWARTSAPLAGLAGLLLLPIVHRWLAKRCSAACDAALGRHRSQPGFSEADYARILAASSRQPE